MPLLERLSTGFIAGVTIVLGIVALGVAEALLKPEAGHGLASIGGALAFAIGLVFLIVGRTNLFTENLFDPVAEVMQQESGAVCVRLGRLRMTILVLTPADGLRPHDPHPTWRLTTARRRQPAAMTHIAPGPRGRVTHAAPMATLMSRRQLTAGRGRRDTAPLPNSAQG